MLRSLMVPLLLLVPLGCGGESDSSSGDPAKVKYAPELGVDLSAMERRRVGSTCRMCSPGQETWPRSAGR